MSRDRGLSGPLTGLLLLALLVLVATLPAAASAAQRHGSRGSFGEGGTGAGQMALRFPELSSERKPQSAGSGIAVDDETGDVYVADTNNHRIDVFDPSRPPAEQFLRAFGADVGGPGIDVCTTGCSPGTAGAEPGQLAEPTFVAVDNDALSASLGDVYVVDTAGTENLVTKFGGEGHLIESWGTDGRLDGSTATDGPFKAIRGIAVDASGDLLVQGGVGGEYIFEFDQAGSFVPVDWRTKEGQQPTGIALDGAGHLYVLGGTPWGPVDRFTLGGANLGRVLGKEPMFFTGLAANQATHSVYIDQEGLLIVALAPTCQPGEIQCSPSEVLGEGVLTAGAGVAVDSATGSVYVAEVAGQKVDEFPVTLEVLPGSVGGVGANEATVHGVIDPKETPVTGCSFQYGPSTAYGEEVACLNAAGEEVDPAHPVGSMSEVHADLTGLAGGTAYHFRLHAINLQKEALSSEDGQFETLKLAKVEAFRITELSQTSVELGATVDPEGVGGTSCKLEWGTSTSYGETVACEPATLSGADAVAVSSVVGGLDPHTTYHFRFVVEDEHGVSVSEPDQTFISAPELPAQQCTSVQELREENDSTRLADCRAYELVTPIQKNGALIGALLFNAIPPALADDGSRMIAPSIQCFEASPSCVGTRLTEGEPFQFARTGDGWQTTSLALPASSFTTSSSWRYDPNTGAALFSAPHAPGEEDEWYTREEGGAVTDRGPLWEGGLTLHSLRSLEPEPTMVSGDFSHILYESQEPLWTFDGGESHAKGLYESPGAVGAGPPRLVAVSGGFESHDLIGICGASLASRGDDGTLSTDGNTVYFEVARCAHGNKVPAAELFARIDGSGAAARTVAISQPAQLAQQNPACTSTECLFNTSEPARFRDGEFAGASSDGARAYFTSPQQLTDEASQDLNPRDTRTIGCPATTGANGCNLYLFEDPQQQPLVGTHLIDVSAGDTSGLGPEVQGVLAISSDGSHAYFVAKGVLSGEANGQGERAAEGADNLYLYERDPAHPQGHTTFVTRLSSADSTSWQKGIGRADVTPDGRYLVFESHRGLTADSPGQGPAQIYRYDARADRLTRISFGDHGFNDDGNAAGEGADARIVGVEKSTLQRVSPARPDPTMSDDGLRIFFQSPVALTPQALSEVPAGGPSELAQNIYEWEAPGQGSCAAAEDRGCVSLISDGTDTAERSTLLLGSTELLGADRSGENVFFATASRLIPADTDSQRDYYDARVGGGFPQPTLPASCQGDACKGPGTSAPAQSTPASAGFSGPEEGPHHPAKVSCKKAQVKKHGKCVAKKPAKHHKPKHPRRPRKNRGKVHHKKRASPRRGGTK